MNQVAALKACTNWLPCRSLIGPKRCFWQWAAAHGNLVAKGLQGLPGRSLAVGWAKIPRAGAMKLGGRAPGLAARTGTLHFNQHWWIRSCEVRGGPLEEYEADGALFDQLGKCQGDMV